MKENTIQDNSFCDPEHQSVQLFLKQSDVTPKLIQACEELLKTLTPIIKTLEYKP